MNAIISKALLLEANEWNLLDKEEEYHHDRSCIVKRTKNYFRKSPDNEVNKLFFVYYIFSIV